MRFNRRVSEWWVEPELKKNRIHVPKYARGQDPQSSDYQLRPRLTGRHGAFKPSNRWVRYGLLEGLDVGYIVPVYSLNEIAARYGLTTSGQRYFRKHILPEPYDLVRRRSVNAHHWSRFTLLALDTVLRDLEKRGYQQFLKRFEDHVNLLHDGSEYLTEYYNAKYDEALPKQGDQFGVDWHDS